MAQATLSDLEGPQLKAIYKTICARIRKQENQVQSILTGQLKRDQILNLQD
jgi:hypothetical protein